MIYVSRLSLLYCIVCSLQPCYHLLGTGWRLGSLMYGSLYVTLCFVLWRFDFGVLTFYFHILSFLFCVLCTILFILNGAIHEVKTRYRRKDGRKRSYKYFNAFIVHVMLVGFFTFEIHAAGNYHKIKNIQVMLQSGFSLCESIQIDPGQFNTR